MISEDFESGVSDWVQLCLKDEECSNTVLQSVADKFIPEIKGSNRGTILQFFAETVLSSSFHPSPFFPENKLILDYANVLENKVYFMLRQVMEDVSGESKL